jgi:hypothetical protein
MGQILLSKGVSGFAVGRGETKNRDKGEIQGSFASLRMTTFLPRRPLYQEENGLSGVFKDGRPRFCPGPSLALYLV